MIWAVVPAKLGKSAKERLAPVLTPELREKLARAMLADVLTALESCAAVERTVVISRDSTALELARAAGALGLVEKTRDGLNASVEEAIAYCVEHGATGVLVAMGDLPLLRADDANAAIDGLPGPGVVLVPSSDGTGTNLVVARPPESFRPRFGLGSLARHTEDLRGRGIAVELHRCEGAALDVDTPGDLERLRAAAPRQTATAEVLRLARGEARLTIGAS